MTVYPSGKVSLLTCGALPPFFSLFMSGQTCATDVQLYSFRTTSDTLRQPPEIANLSSPLLRCFQGSAMCLSIVVYLVSLTSWFFSIVRHGHSIRGSGYNRRLLFAVLRSPFLFRVAGTRRRCSSILLHALAAPFWKVKAFQDDVTLKGGLNKSVMGSYWLNGCHPGHFQRDAFLPLCSEGNLRIVLVNIESVHCDFQEHLLDVLCLLRCLCACVPRWWIQVLRHQFGYLLVVSCGICTRSPSVLRGGRPCTLLEHARGRRQGHPGVGARDATCVDDHSHSCGLLECPPVLLWFGYGILSAEFHAGISAILGTAC